MSSTSPLRQSAGKPIRSNQEQLLRTLIQDLEGVEKLQQMQSRLLREAIQEARKLTLK